MLGLTKLSLKRPVTLILTLITILVFGLSSVVQSKMELMPEMSLPMFVVSTVYPGASPEDITELVTKPIEEAMVSLNKVDNIRSQSSENSSLVIVQYEYGTDMDRSYMDLKKVLDAMKSSLPEEAREFAIIEIDMNAQSSMDLIVSANTSENLYNYVKTNIIPEFEKLSSVGKVDISGGRSSYIKIELNREKMEQYHLDMQTVATLISSANFTIPTGSAKYGDQNVAVSVSANYKDIEKMKDIILPLASGEVVHLSDIADIYETLEDKSSLSRYNGEDVLTVSITKQQSASAVDVSKEVNNTIKQILANNDSIQMEVINDAADNIRDSINSVFQTLLLAVLLSMIVLFVFFGDIKASLIVGSSIPVSVLLSLTAMRAAGYSMNIISVGGLSLGIGMIVDNSIVILESCFRAKETKNFYEAAIDGTKMVIDSVLGSTLTTCVVFLPLALLKGLTGQLFSQLGFTIIFCMVSSFLSAIMVVPLLFLFFHPVEKEDTPIYKILLATQAGYRKAVRFLLPKKAFTVIISVVLLVVSVIMGVSVGMEMMPANDVGQISITIETKPGLSIEKVDALAKQVESVVAAEEDTEKYQFTYGSASLYSSSTATVTAYLKKDRKLSTDEVASKWKKAFVEIPDAVITVENYSAATSGFDTFSVDIPLQSADYQALKQASLEIVDELRKQDYLTNVHSDAENGAPIVDIDIDAVKANALGLTPVGIGSVLNQNMGGKEVMKYTKNGSEINVRIEYPKGSYESIEDIKSMLLTTPTGKKVSLEDVANIGFKDSSVSIIRSDKKYQVSITAVAAEGYEETALSLANQFIDERGLPTGVERAVNISNTMMMKEITALFNALLTAVFLIFIVMAIQFESPRFSFMVMFTIPFAMIGSFGLLWLFNVKISMVSMIGFLMLVGTVVNNGILYVDTVNQMRTGMDLREALVESGAIRIRPILLTTLTTVLSMIPLAMAIGDSGETLQALALVNIGGLVASTLISLLLLPVLYEMIDKGGRKILKVDEYKDID